MNKQGRSFDDQAPRRVSFILPTKNKAEFIGKALDMARGLVGPEDELIVVDGASTDGTAEIIASYGEVVDIFVSEPDVTPEHAINKGMLLARGKYIKLIFDDDEFFPDAMKQVIEVMEAHPEVDVLYCGGMRQMGDQVWPVYLPPGVNYGKCPEDVFRYGVCGCGIFIRHNALSRTGLYDFAAVASDGEYIARSIHRKANVKFCRINLFHHPIYDHSRTIERKRDYGRETDWIVRKYCSTGFYWRYRLRGMLGRLVRRYVMLRWPVLGTRQVLRRALTASHRWRRRDHSDPGHPTWDGGFS